MKIIYKATIDTRRKFIRTQKRSVTAIDYPEIHELQDDDESHDVKEKPSKQRSRRRNITPASRAEKSRCAAKFRRDRESEELANLTELLPFDPEVVKNLDKASILRLATCYLHMKQITKQGLDALIEDEKSRDIKEENEKLEENSPEALGLNESDLMLEAFDGFLLFVTRTGRIIYASEGCERHIGIPQHELIGHGVLEFIHNEDHKEFVKQFREKSQQGAALHPALPAPCDSPSTLDDIEDIEDPQSFIQERIFYVRMKCHLPRPGTKTKQIGHLLTQWTGRLQLQQTKKNSNGYPIQGLVAVVRPLHSTPIIEIRLDGNMFMSRHDLGMRYTFCDPRIINLAGYEPRELIGHTAYQFHNPLDAQKIQHCHSNLIQKGTSVSKYYRFLGKTGDWVWMKTRATIIYNSCNEPQYVVCLNYVYSEEEGRRYQMLEEEQNGHPQPEGIKAFTTFTQMEAEQAQLTRQSPCCSPSSGSPSSGYESDSAPCNSFKDHFPMVGFQWTDLPYSSDNSVDVGFTSPAQLSPAQLSPAQLSPASCQSPYSCQLSPNMPEPGFPVDDPFDQGTSKLTYEPALDVDWLDKVTNDLMEATGVTLTQSIRAAVFDHDYTMQPMDTQGNLSDVCDVDFDMFDSTLLDENTANNTFLSGSRMVQPSQPDSTLLQLLGSANVGGANPAARPSPYQSATMTVSSFPKHLMPTIGPAGNNSRSQQEFAVKFAQNMVEQRMRQDMLSYLSEETDIPPPSRQISYRDHSYTASNTAPTTSASRQAKKSVPYSTQGSYSRSHGSRSRRTSSASSSRHNSPPSTPTSTENKASTLLEQMLLSKEPLNPNKGSDEVFACKSGVTQGLSQLNIEEQADGNLLKQLLTGEINDKHVQQYERSIIENRKRDDGDSGHPSDDDDGDYAMWDLSCDKILREPMSQQRDLSLELFDPETAGDMANLLGPISSDMEILMHSEMDDILKEQMRQDDLWLQQYYKDL